MLVEARRIPNRPQQHVLGNSGATSERAKFFRSSRPCPKLNGCVAGLTLEYPAKVLFTVESASIADLLDA